MMWKAFYLSAVIITLDFPRAILSDGESIEPRAESLKRNDARKLLEDPRETSGDHGERYYEDEYPRTYDQKDDVRRRPYDRDKEEIRRRPYAQDGKHAVLIGKWRNNGEALEPEWRDGDSMPLFPFSHLSRPKDDDRDKDYDSPTVDDTNEPRYYVRDDERDANADRRTAHFRDPELSRKPHRGNLRRKNSKPKINVDAADSLAVLEVTDRDDAARFKAYNDKENNDTVSIRYREALQVHPNEYEQELNDEEYLKPRPRKRRPPQNYEFALAANEAALRKENSSPETRSYTRGGSIFSSGTDSGRKKNDTRPKPSENALELKSLLKMQQEEGLSLSEILQRRNLTLHDLLRGKADIISVLKSKDFDETLEDIEQVSRAMSDSLMKLSITERPRWTPSNHSEKPVRLTTKSPVYPTSERNMPRYTTPLETKITTPMLEKEHKLMKPADSNDVESIGFSLKTEDTGRVMPIIITLKPAEKDSAKFSTTTAASGSMQPTVIISDSLESSKKDANVKSSDGTDEMKSYVLDEDEIMEFSDFPDYKKVKSNNPSRAWTEEVDEEKTTESNEFRDDQPETGSTLSIEHILIPTEKTKTYKKSENKTQDGKSAFSEEIPLNDFTMFFESEYQNDFPMDITNEEEEENTMRVSNDTNTTLKINKTKTDMYDEEKHKVSLPENHQTEVSSTKSYEDILSEIVPEARAEIFELFASSSSGRRLERLLKSRNMSLEELIALRQRGSSKVHLASVRHLKDQMAKSLKTEYDDNLDNERTNSDVINIAINTRSEENRMKKESQRSGNVQVRDSFVHRDDNFLSKEVSNQQSKGDTADLTTIVPNTGDQDTYKKQTNKGKNSENPSDILDLLTTFASLPFGKTQYGNFAEKSSDHTTDTTVKLQESRHAMYLETTEIPVAKGNQSAIERVFVDELGKKDPLSIDMEAAYNSSTEDEERSETIEKKSLSKVKPSIIASGAILGVTIVVFLAILITCKIRQKQKYTYRNTFSRAVFQGPVTAARKLSNTSSLSAVMVNVVATSTAKRPERTDEFDRAYDSDPKSDIDNDSLDANDSWETIPDYLK